MRTPRLTKQQTLDRLQANIIERLRWLGATDAEPGRLSLPTRLGPLFIRPSRNALEPGTPPNLTIFCRFHDPACLTAFKLQGNHITGKWNWHHVDADGINAFMKEIERITEC